MPWYKKKHVNIKFFFEIIYLYSYKIKSKHALIASQNNIGRFFFFNCTRQFVVKQVFARINSARHKGSQMELKFSKRLQRKQTCNLVNAKTQHRLSQLKFRFSFKPCYTFYSNWTPQRYCICASDTLSMWTRE